MPAATVALDGHLHTDTFVGFTNLTSVTWDNVENYHQFDNVVVSAATAAVPGPLAALPFALMAVKRRRRKA